MKTLFTIRKRLLRFTGRAALFSGVMVFLMLLGACQKPFVPPPPKQMQDAPFTAMIDYRRSNYMAVAYPDSLTFLQKISLNSEPASTFLRSGWHLLFSTLQGYLYSLNSRDISARYNTRLAKAVSAAPSLQKELIAFAAEKGTYGLTVYDLSQEKILWREKALFSRSSPLILGKRLIHVSVDGKLSAFDLRSGKQLWQVTIGHKIFTDAAADEKMIVILSRDGWLQTFNPLDGALLWQLPLKDRFYAPPLLNDAAIHIAGYSGKCLAVERISGKIIWQTSAEAPLLAPMAADETSLYITAANGLCRAIDLAGGAEKWRVNLNAPLSAVPLATQNKLWLGSSQKKLIAIDKRTGRLLHTIKLPGRPSTAPLLLGRKIFIACEYRTIAIYGTNNED